jgi:drug/metabolite transporter (DMT)-like permease
VSSFVVSGVMWGLYTNALRRSPSAIQCNVLNTSANFVCAALAGNAIFGESLPGLWWVGAALLIAGTVIIGKRATGAETERVGEEKKKT